MQELPTLVLAGLIASVTAATATTQTQGPDILIPSGSLDGAYALVDKNKDGKYTTAGEAWDYVKALVNTSPRNYVLIGKKIFFTDTGRDQVVWVEDANGNGLIDPATERHVYYDVAVGVGGLTPAFCALGKNGWLWWINDGGTGEGIYRSKDLNNDGDAEDTVSGKKETVAVLTETMTQVKIANTPKTKAFLNGAVRTLSTTEIDSIIFDSTFGTNGRWIVEDEWSDQTLAFEDKNNDGDFNDLGECYLFCALYPGSTITNPRTSRIDHDANPDVISGKLPISNEIRNHAIDFATVPPTYYLMSGETNATQVDAAIIFKGQDKNKDGDINDAGETTIFWDGSLNSTGATKTFNFTIGMAPSALGGSVYVNAEWDGTPDAEQLLMLRDRNKDGDANDAGETTMLWNLGVDKTHYTPAVLPAGTLKALKVQTTLTKIFYYGNASCPTSRTSGTAFHNIQFGVSSATSGSGSSKNPNLGNAKWLVRTWGAKETANGAYGIGLTKIDPGVPLGAGGVCRVYQSFDILSFFFTTDSTGANNQILAVPNTASLLGLRTYWQSVVADAASSAGLGFTLSDAFDATFGDWTYTR